MGRAAVDLYGEQIGARLEDQSSFARYLGGCPANIAVGSARLGLRVAMLTRVGDEHNGRFVRETLAAAQNGQDGEVDWAATLHPSRSALSQRHLDDPKNNRQWALPVLYVRPEPFLVRVGGPAAIPDEELRAMRERAEEVAAALRALPPETPAAVRGQLLAIVDDVPDWMQPNAQGEFARQG